MGALAAAIRGRRPLLGGAVSPACATQKVSRTDHRLDSPAGFLSTCRLRSGAVVWQPLRDEVGTTGSHRGQVLNCSAFRVQMRSHSLASRCTLCLNAWTMHCWECLGSARVLGARGWFPRGGEPASLRWVLNCTLGSASEERWLHAELWDGRGILARLLLGTRRESGCKAWSLSMKFRLGALTA